MMELNLLVALVSVHFICDFYLQPTSWVECRNTRHHKSPKLMYHACIHGLISFLVLILFSDSNLLAVFAYSLLILSSHFVIDLIKSYWPSGLLSFALDQFAHLIIILFVWALITHQLSEIVSIFSLVNVSYKHSVVFVSYIVILKPASVLISMLLRPWTEKLNKASQLNEVPQSDTSLSSAGRRIGYMERLLILTFILLNQFPAIGFLLAAKSVFRFGDLSDDHDKKLTEYVMLGTLTSFTITIFIGIIVTAITGHIPIGK